MGLSSPGVGSGLDVSGIVSSLVSAEITPLQTRLDKKLTTINTKISDAGKIKSALANLQTSLANLADSKKLFTNKLTVSDDSYLSATASSLAAKGTYQVEVKILAQQHSIATDYIADVNSVGNGTIHLAIGKYSGGVFTENSAKDIVIAPGSESLTSIRDAINNADAGVTASIVKDDTGSRLTITSNTTGEANAIQVTTTGGLGALKYDPTDVGTADGFVETIAAQDSQVKINGLLLTQGSNQLNDALAGITINLKKAEVGKIINLDVSDNKDQVNTLISDFVKKYNDAMTTLNSLTSYDQGTKVSGSYQNDSQIKNLKMNLTQLVTGEVSSINNTIKTVADIGLKLNRQGLIEVDQDKLTAALANNYKEVGNLFAKSASASDPNIQVTGITDKLTAGSYNVVLSAYTAGTSVEGTIGGLSATAIGTKLSGTGALLGLTINVSGGLTGARGSITINDGIAEKASDFLTAFLDSRTGDLTQKINQLKEQAKDLDNDQDKIDVRKELIQNKYLKQFSSLDVLMSQMQSTSSYLTQQLASLAKMTT